MPTIERMTPQEFDLRMTARRLKEVDKEYIMHRMAWLNREITAQKKAGKGKTKPYYSKFIEFFDFDEMERIARGEKPQKKFSTMGEKLLAAMRMRDKNG